MAYGCECFCCLIGTVSSITWFWHYYTKFDFKLVYADMRGFMTAHGQPDQSRSARYILKDYVSVSTSSSLEWPVLYTKNRRYTNLVMIYRANSCTATLLLTSTPKTFSLSTPSLPGRWEELKKPPAVSTNHPKLNALKTQWIKISFIKWADFRVNWNILVYYIYCY